MGGEKPTVPENMRDTLTSSDYNSVRTLSFIKLMF